MSRAHGQSADELPVVARQGGNGKRVEETPGDAPDP